MKFENTEVWGFEHAIRGMRNPMNSGDKSDSYDAVDCKACGVIDREGHCNPKEHDCSPYYCYEIGPNDMDLAQRLIKAGPEHCKFLRQIFVSVDIDAPLYWWKEFDTYKVGTTANSCSTMHKITSEPITLKCFEGYDYTPELPMIDDVLLGIRVSCLIDDLEQLRQKFLMTKDKRYWKELIRWLPESWLQKRTGTGSYANLRNMYFQRRHHKLDEWSVLFCRWVESLPYAKELILYED